ncbi:MAG: hypothetical protein K2Q13_04540 [Nitrosomonas sp.]|uniref:hypothetical protein n=1 Tax=Nitrosomonas sp. TaxID=42353 RepID=UPI0025EB8495|nr:hypothetical protein [Nitrosomonas sp.]MBY0474317.1 hypothetical protein [Nitrosomonas sp.]
MLAEKRLTEVGFTLDQAINFINTNISQPQVIFETAAQYGVNTRMLSEISGHSKDIVHEYFLNTGYDSATINTTLNTNLLVNSDLSALEILVSFNSREDILSNASLREVVKPVIDANYDYDGTFGPVNISQSNDGIYSSGELGVEKLDNVPTSSDNLESLFYGSLINIFLRLDQTELDQINTFPANDDPDEFQVLILDTLSATPDFLPWSDEQLADLVTDEAIDIMDKYWTSDLVGVLDHSLLGLATV